MWLLSSAYAVTVCVPVDFNSSLCDEEEPGILEAYEHLKDINGDHEVRLQDGYQGTASSAWQIDGAQSFDTIEFRGQNTGAILRGGSGSEGIFRILADANVEFRNITFEPAVGSRAVWVESGTVTLNDITVRQSPFVAVDSVYLTAVLVDDGTLDIIDSTFERFHTTSGPAHIEVNGDSLSITDSTLSQGLAPEGSVFADSCASVQFQNATFEDSDSESAGQRGAVTLRNVTNAAIDDSNFRRNEATANDSGGALLIRDCDDVAITNSNFADNLANGNRGGAGLYVHNSQVTVTDSVFAGNRVTGANVRGGGAVYFERVDGTAAVPTAFTRVEFRENHVDSTTTGGGGAIHVRKDGHLLIDDCDFVGNTAMLGGAIHARAEDSPTLILENSRFGANVSNSQGGAIYAQTSVPVMSTGNTFAGNRADTNNGGALHALALNSVDDTFCSNTAGSSGAAIWTSENDGLDLVGAVLFDNRSSVIVRANRDALIDHSTFVANDGNTIVDVTNDSVVRNTAFAFNVDNVGIDHHPSATIEFNAFYDNAFTPQGSDTVAADPLITIPAPGTCERLDVQPANGSPLAGAASDGTDIGALDVAATDADGDGFSPPFDCDDNDANVFPGAPELCNGIDDDCTGLPADEADADGDTFRICDGDCDDGDSSINPGATEVCNGIDDDCNGLEADEADGDADGWLICENDCDDGQASINPGADDICNEVDDDCDGTIDEDEAPGTFFEDIDGDGYGDGPPSLYCVAPAGWVALDGDCDDGNLDVNPGVLSDDCDTLDNDCDGSVDENELPGTFYTDADEDGYGAGAPIVACDQPEGTSTDSTDCNDGDDATNPGAPELCAAGDQNCDSNDDFGAIDAFDQYYDGDGDGYGNPTVSAPGCDLFDDYVTNDGDCDDNSPLAWTGNEEVCDGVDNDCVNGADGPDATDAIEWFPDNDGDLYGVGTPGTGVVACTAPDNHREDSGDCDDNDATVNPGEPEQCDDIDHDCDGDTDDAETVTWYPDGDGDGFGTNGATMEDCAQPPGFSSSNTDCDDSEASINPAAPETCDGFDSNCTGNENDATDQVLWYPDLDNDDFGDQFVPPELACDPPSPSHVLVTGDCDDGANAINPDADEICDGIDNDCNGIPDDNPAGTAEFYEDMDGDGFGGAPQSFCPGDEPPDFVDVGGDCDDANAEISPDAEESCDEVDNDCDGQIDEDGPETWYVDMDGDDFGAGALQTGCFPPENAVDNNEDCDDNDIDENPAAVDDCDNGLDLDCVSGLDCDTDDTDDPVIETGNPCDDDDCDLEKPVVTGCACDQNSVPPLGLLFFAPLMWARRR